jgi:heme exporter protein C
MKAYRGILLALGAAATLYTFLSPDAQKFNEPALARIMFWHVPSAILSTIFAVMMAWFGFKTLKTHSLEQDTRLAGSAELAMIFSLITLVTGMIFSKVQWLAYWNWDPRQTSFLFVVLLLGGLIALRAGMRDDAKRAAASGAYAVANIIPFIFLTFVYPRMPGVASLHPNETIQSGLDIWYSIGLWGTLVVLALISFYIFKLRVRAGLLELETLNNGNNSIRGGDSAPSGVVRPLAVSEED